MNSTTNKKLLEHIKEQIKKREFDLEQLEFIYEERRRFNIKTEEAMVLLELLYQETMDEAMKDGHLSNCEQKYLLQIKSYMSQKNKLNTDMKLFSLKKRLTNIVYKVKEHNEHYGKNHKNFQHKSYQHKQEVKQEIKRKLPSPFKILKPTPFSNM